MMAQKHASLHMQCQCDVLVVELQDTFRAKACNRMLFIRGHKPTILNHGSQESQGCLRCDDGLRLRQGLTKQHYRFIDFFHCFGTVDVSFSYACKHSSSLLKSFIDEASLNQCNGIHCGEVCHMGLCCLKRLDRIPERFSFSHKALSSIQSEI